MSEGNTAVEVTRAKVRLVLELAKLERDTLVSGLTEDEMESIVVAILRCRTAGPFTSLGKQVLAHGSHYADAINVHTAEFITDALNRKVSTSDETARLRSAGKRLIAVFDQQRMTAAERIIVGISDAGLRTEGNAAIEALRAALQSQDIPS